LLEDIRDIITYATFGDDRLRGLGVAGGRFSRFPIDLRRRPYNTVTLPCECVIMWMQFECCLFHARSRSPSSRRHMKRLPRLVRRMQKAESDISKLRRPITSQSQVTMRSGLAQCSGKSC